MKLISRGNTLVAKSECYEDSVKLRGMVETHTITDMLKTNYGTKVINVFSPLPYNVRTQECFMYKTYFQEVCNGTEISIHKESSSYKNVTLPFNKDLVLRDTQKPLVDKLVKIKDNEVLGLVLATGRGKTFTICKTLSILELRTFIYIKAEYVEKWVKDITKHFDIEEDEYYVVQGSASLRKLLNSTREDLSKVKIYIIALQTFRVYIENFLCGKGEYPITPPNFLKHIEADVMLCDEGHESFENIYRAYVMLAPRNTFVLTATLYSIDNRVETFMKELIPEENRVTDGHINRHAISVGVQYAITNGKNIEHKTHMGYNHTLLEKSFSRRRLILEGIFEMYGAYIDAFHMKTYVQGDKLVIYFATTDMCKLFIEYMSERYKQLKCSIYVQGYTFETVIESDVVATTMGKMGSAIDVPSLTTVLQTVVVNSRTKNEQTIGRLRPMDGRDLHYIYFNCMDLNVHVRNYSMRRGVLGNVSEKLITTRYTKRI